jgi:hypothetical protein
MPATQRYTLNEVYTSDDRDKDRSRRTLTFETDAVGALEVAVAARLTSMLWSPANTIFRPDEHPGVLQTIDRVRQHFAEDDVADQLALEDPADFSFLLFSNDGEWYYEVQLVSDTDQPQ